MRASFDLLVDMKDLAICSDVISPAVWHGPLVSDHAIGSCRGLTRIAQNGIVQFERFGETLIGIGVIAASGKIGHLELTQLLATLTE